MSISLGARIRLSRMRPEFADTIWQEVEEGSREDWNAFSYFVVTESSTHRTAPVFVCSDWPTAEAFAKTLF